MKILFIFFILVFLSCSQKKLDSGDDTSVTGEDSLNEGSKSERKIVTSDLKTGQGFSTPVISDAQKFIIPVPAFRGGGEPLVYPKRDPRAGKPILDYEGKPIGKSGIVFFNFKDQSLQAAAGDGKSVIIINEVTQAQARLLENEIFKLQADPRELTLKELKQILEFAHKKLELSDMYNSTRSYIKDKLTPVIAAQKNGKSTDELFGLKKRDDRDINQAVYITGTFVFEGTAASAQKFDNGGVIIEQGGEMRGVQPDIFARTYKLADGSTIRDVTKDIKSQGN